MPRTYVPKGLRQTDRTSLEEAFNYRVRTNCSIRAASKKYDLKPTTLQDAFKRSKKYSDGKTYIPPKKNVHKVFTMKEEGLLSTYTIKIAKMFNGLPRTEFRKLAYRHAVACKSSSIPTAWKKDHAATNDWYYAFMSRHPELTLKSLEGGGPALMPESDPITNQVAQYLGHDSAIPNGASPLGYRSNELVKPSLKIQEITTSGQPRGTIAAIDYPTECVEEREASTSTVFSDVEVKTESLEISSSEDEGKLENVKRRKLATTYNVSEFSERSDTRDKTTDKQDDLDLFFASVCLSTRNLPRRLQNQVKKDILDSIVRAEAQNEYQL